MADNYLEKRFEEHMNAPYKTNKKHTPTHFRRCVVTGGAHGIGAAIVKSLRTAGHKVSFCDINDALGQETALRTGANFVCLDIANVAAFQNYLNNVATSWGDIDVIINNAGIFSPQDILNLNIEDFDHVQAVNVRPVVVSAQFMAKLRANSQNNQPNQPQKPYGRIINICSTRQRQSEPSTEAYAASKGAIFSLTHALAQSLAPYAITVNSISPGWIECNDYDNLRPEDHLQHPSRRVGKPEDVARLVRFIIDDANDFLNAENIVLDGGISRKMIYID